MALPSRHIRCPLLVMLVLGCADGTPDVAPIRLEPMITLGADAGDGALATWPRVSARHPLGYRVLVPQPGAVPALPVVYGDSGQFLGTLGGHDSLPDGFVEPLFARIGPGDSVWVFDGARRVLVFTPERQFARSVALPVAPWDAVVLTGGRLAVAPALFGQPLPWLLLDNDGAVLQRIGTPDSTVPSPRKMIAGTEGTIWTVAMTHRWRLEQWDLSGTLLRRFEVAPEWFAEYGELEAPTPERAPQASVQDAWVDPAGRLWIVGKAGDPQWRDGLQSGESGSAIDDVDRVYDTVVEVRDGTSGAVLAHARFDVSYPFIAEPGVLMRVQDTAEGWHRAELVRVMVDASRLGAVP
jgi:hypothetical protein